MIGRRLPRLPLQLVKSKSVITLQERNLIPVIYLIWIMMGTYYDNNMEVVTCLISILGYLIAILAEPNIYLAIFLWGVAYLVDDIGWAIVYFKNKELLVKDESS